MKRLLALAFLCCAGWLPAAAERPPDRFLLMLGGFASSLDTNIRLDSASGQVGVELDFEDGFNLASREVVPIAGIDFWISKKHGLGLLVFDLSRSSTGESTIEFRFGEEVFPAGVPLSVRFDTQVVALTYSYKFFNNRKRSFGLNAGFNVNSIDAAIATQSGPSISESGAVTAPLPVFGVNGHVALGKKWYFYGTTGVFGLSYDQYDGFLGTLSAGTFHQTFKHVGFGVGYYGFDIRIDSENDRFLGKINYSYKGPVAYVTVRY